MSPGSALFYLGSLWHGGGANSTARPRLGVILEYAAGWLRPQENHCLAVPRNIVRDLPERLQELLGYNIYPPFVGTSTAGASPGPVGRSVDRVSRGPGEDLRAVVLQPLLRQPNRTPAQEGTPGQADGTASQRPAGSSVTVPTTSSATACSSVMIVRQAGQQGPDGQQRHEQREQQAADQAAAGPGRPV